MNSNTIEKDGWEEVWQHGSKYWDFYDEGDFVFRCTLKTRDEILRKSGLPLVVINSEGIPISEEM